MPYIKKELREELEQPLNDIIGPLQDILIDRKNDRAGILNYVITSLIDSCYGPLSNAKYKDYNEAIGMLECCKLEFYRKAAAPYEELKERENGSVLDGKRVKIEKPKAIMISNVIIDKDKTNKLHKNIKKKSVVNLFNVENIIVKDKE